MLLHKATVRFCAGLLALSFGLSACSDGQAPNKATEFDFNNAVRILETLSNDDMQGRRLGTDGRDRAADFLESEIQRSGDFDDVLRKPFKAKAREQELQGINLQAHIHGPTPGKGPLLVVTAHYDHVGVRPLENSEDTIYNGADDNASGAAALFAIAQSFTKTAPDHDVMFIWFDGEEFGLQGARATLNDGTFGDRSLFNINLDMVSRNDKDELYMAGSHHMPELKPLLKGVADQSGISLKFGHDRPEDGTDDWTLQSDHGVFHKNGVPFAYFGVEDHPHYHKTSDEFSTIPLEFYEQSLITIIKAAHILDENLVDLARPVAQAPPN